MPAAAAKPPVVPVNYHGPDPLPPRNPITVTLTCPAHGEVARETHGHDDAPGSTAIAAGLVARKIHEAATGCTERLNVDWRKSHAAAAAAPVVQLRQPTVGRTR